MSPVITEHHVRSAAASGSLMVPAGALVTPAARELAARLGVALTEGHGPETEGLEAPARRAAASAPASPGATVALGADHGGYRMKETLKPVVESLGFRVEDVGCHSTDSVDYPVFAAKVADLVADGTAAFGIMVDGAGTGSAMVANKVAGVRAALCYDLTTAKNARDHNDANVLTLGGTLIGDRLASDIVTVFLSTAFGGGRHARRVAMIEAMDGDKGDGGRAAERQSGRAAGR